MWGRRLLQSRVIFLAGGDVLHQPAEQVEAYLDAIGRTFPIRQDRRATADASASRASTRSSTISLAPSVSVETGSRLAERGLGRVSLGVESGDPEVAAVYGKDWDDDDLRATVADLEGGRDSASAS